MSKILIAMSMDEILAGMAQSLDAANESVAKVLAGESDESYPELVQQLLDGAKLEEVSLLNLKNSSMASYIHNVVMVILSQVERLRGGDEAARLKLVENAIAQRVTLERGIKPLEKKLNYQLDKMIRAYSKMQQDTEDKESDSDSESSEDELSYKPDASSLIKKPMKETETTEDTYKPPRISAMAPPSRPTDEPRSKSSKKLQSMEEYLRESSDLPSEEKSIGANIVDHGRGGVKTSIDRKKEQEIQTYEEDNFTRLPTTMTKKDKRQTRKDMENTFGGEDFSMFNNSRDFASASRKRKPGSVWDKVKRRK